MNVSWSAFMARLRDDEPAPGWSLAFALGLLALYFIVNVFAQFFLGSLVDPLAIQAGAITPLALNLGAAVGGALVVGMVWVLLRPRVRGPVYEALRLQRGTLSTWLLVLIGLGAVISIDFVPLIFQTVGLPVSLVGLAGETAASWLLAALVVLVIGPVVLTLLLQGVLYPVLAAARDNAQAVLLTALAETAVIVALGDPADPVLWLQAFLTGVYLTAVRAHQKSTWAALLSRVVFGVFALAKAARLFL